MNPTISIIAALGENRAIGNKGQIPWHIKADLIHFRDLTLHHIVIMGRKAFDSMNEYYKKVGRPLPDRIHIVVTRDKTYKPVTFIGSDDALHPTESRVHVVHSIEEAINLARSLCHSRESGNLYDGEIFIGGGGQIYDQGIKFADKLYLTIVHQKFDADAFFPEYFEFKKELSREEKTEGAFHFTFLELTR